MAALALLLVAILLGGALAGPGAAPPAEAAHLAVAGIAIQSNAGTDRQYHAGDNIVVRVTFNNAITAHSSASITLDIGGVSRNAVIPNLASGGTATALDFTYTVADTDSDADGVAIAAGTLGGSYTATHAHTGLAYTQTVSAAPAHRVNVDTIDYDTDGDGLIEIDSLVKLDAIRYDLDGNGQPHNAANYAAAFPARSESHGCPDTADADTNPGPCIGYELTANLDFDTNGDGDVDSSDDYPNWTPIGGVFTSVLDGRGHTISNLTINNNGQHVGMFNVVQGSGSAIRNLGLLDVDIDTTGAHFRHEVGAIAAEFGTRSGGQQHGTISAVYVTGNINATHTSSGYTNVIRAAGFIGYGAAANIVSSYSLVNITWSATSQSIGGVAGETTGNGGSINMQVIDSYVAGPINNRDQFDGGFVAEGAVSSTNSYWDTQATGQPNSGNISGGSGRTTAQMKGESGYTGIYANWNRDLDNADGDNDAATGRDDPWHIRQGHYPALKYAGFNVNGQGPKLGNSVAGRDGTIYAGQTVTLDAGGARSLWPAGATLEYAWSRDASDASGAPDAALNLPTDLTTARLAFTAPAGLTEDTTLVFRLTVTDGLRTVYDLVPVAVRVAPNRLASLSLADAEGDAVSIAPPFANNVYAYRAWVPNQIDAITLTPRALTGATITVNGRAAASGAGIDVPLNYRDNEIAIAVTPPEPPADTANGDGDSGGDTNGDAGDAANGNGDASDAPTGCATLTEPCTYTLTVRRAVPPRLAFSDRSLTLDEGGMATYTVELDTPILTAPVTIAIASDNPSVTVSPSEVTLRPLNASPRTITVTAVADDDRDDERATITHTANGAHYYDVVATVSVKVNDTTEPPPPPDPALSVSATALELAEGGSQSYTVALATEPEGNVTVAIASDNLGVTVRPALLTFTPANWGTAQRVTASAASDDDADDGAATLTHTASGGGYGAAPAVRVAVSVADDDTAGLSINPTAINLRENGISAYTVALTAQPSANVTVTNASDNGYVNVRPAALTFTPSNWAAAQAVLVTTRVDGDSRDDRATLRIAASGGGYAGISGAVSVLVDDRLLPLPSSALTTRPGAPAGVGIYVRPGTAARVTLSPSSDDTPTVATGAGFAIGAAVGISVSNAPAGGVEICLPVSSELRAEAGSGLVLTLLRYAGGSWMEMDGARDLGDLVCAGGVAGEAAYAPAYALRPGTVLDSAAAVGDAPGTVVLSWTPPAAGTAQVAVVVNVSDDTDYCLDVLPGLDASEYACAGRTPGAAYVALLIVLLPDGGYTLANIVTIGLPATSATP